MFASNDLVVVGRVSMNRKKAKKNLQRIANNVEPERTSPLFPTAPARFTAAPVAQAAPAAPRYAPVEVPVVAPEPLYVAVQAPIEAPAERVCWADMLSDDDEPLPPKRVLTTRAAAPAPAPEESDAKKRRTHRGGRSATKRFEQDCRRKPEAFSALAALPEVVLARIFEGVELRAVGAAAATGRALRLSVWSAPSFWTALAADTAIASADGFRKWLFGLHGDWAPAFATYCRTAEPADALGEAAYLAGGLVAADSTSAFLAAVLDAASRVAQDWDTAAAALAAVAAKVAARPRVFAGGRQVLEAVDALRERALLAKLAEDDAWTGFDPFAEEEAAEFDEDAAVDLFEPKEEETLNLDFAESFLELLDA